MKGGGGVVVPEGGAQELLVAFGEQLAQLNFTPDEPQSDGVQPTIWRRQADTWSEIVVTASVRESEPTSGRKILSVRYSIRTEPRIVTELALEEWRSIRTGVQDALCRARDGGGGVTQ